MARWVIKQVRLRAAEQWMNVCREVMTGLLRRTEAYGAIKDLNLLLFMKMSPTLVYNKNAYMNTQDMLSMRGTVGMPKGAC